MIEIKVPNWVANLPFVKAATTPKKTQKVPADMVGVAIVQENAHKNRKDIEDWRNAIMAADNLESPKWLLIQDLYDYIMVDANTHSLIELRKAATLSTRAYIYDAVSGEELPEKTALLQTEWFYNFLGNLLDAPLRGCMAAQLINPVTMKFFYIPQRNLAPNKNLLRLKADDDKCLKIEEIPNIIFTKDNYQYGYLNDVVPLILWKLNVLMSWAEATEKYGIPPLIATTTKSLDKDVTRIQNMLKQAGESLSAVLPEGTKVEVMKDYDKIDPEKMFGGLLKVCDDAIAKRIVGGTMINADGSSRSQSEVHQGNFDSKIIEADKRKCEFVVNGQLLPLMRLYGYQFGDNDKMAFDRKQAIDYKAKGEMLKIVLEHYEVNEDWIRKDLQIPITKPKQKYIDENFKKASMVWAAALEAKGITLPKYSTTNCCSTITADAIDNELLNELAELLINEVFESKNTTITSLLMAIQTQTNLTKGLFDGWGKKRLTLNYDTPDVGCLSSMEYNLMEFSLTKSQADVLALNELLIDTKTQNKRPFTEFKALAQKHLNTTNSRHLLTEYNHAVAVGQNSRAYLQFKQEEDTVTRYVQWQTAGDTHVRPEHAKLNGIVFDLKEPGGLTIVPPKDWGCRCELVQYLGKPPKEKLYTNAQGLQALDIAKGSKWDINRADARQVFAANEMYLKKAGLVDNKLKASYKVYGLEKRSEMSNLPKITLDDSITEANVAELFKAEPNKDFMGFTDYLGRKLILPKSTFTKHTKGYYTNNQEQRHQLFPLIEDVLSNPDEVYFDEYDQSKSPYQTKYIKHYNDRSITVAASIINKKVTIFSWYNLKGSEEKQRKGYLIFNKKR